MAKQRHQNVPASYLTFLKDDKILLQRRFNTGYQDGKYSMVAGHVDAGETFTEAIIREAKEEAGIVLNPEDLKVFHVMHRKSGLSETSQNDERVDIFFIADSWKGEISNKEPHKCDDLSWFDINKLPDNIIPYVRQAVEEGLQQKVFYSEHGWDTN